MKNLHTIKNLEASYNHLLFVNSGVTEILLLTNCVKFINTNGVFEDLLLGDTVMYNPETKEMFKVNDNNMSPLQIAKQMPRRRGELSESGRVGN